MRSMSRLQARAKIGVNILASRPALADYYLRRWLCVDGRLACANFGAVHRHNREQEKRQKAIPRARSLRKVAKPVPMSRLFRARVEAALAKERANQGFWGVLVTDRDTGETLYDLNSGHFFAPASNAKLFTTAFALATLGPKYQYSHDARIEGRAGSGRSAGRRFDFGGARRSRSFESKISLRRKGGARRSGGKGSCRDWRMQPSPRD